MSTKWTDSPEEKRFWTKVERRNDDECWPWLGAINAGYGKFHWSGGQLAHRFAYELLVGPIPRSLTLDHLCHTNDQSCREGSSCSHRSCVNPLHLEPVELKINNLRGRSPWADSARQTHCHKGHLLEGDNVRIEGGKSRRCKTCKQEYDASRVKNRKRKWSSRKRRIRE